MSLRVAVQMDPLESIKISGDSTFAIMLKAQELGLKLYHYLTEDLTYNDGRLYAGAHEVSVQAVAGDHFRRGDFAILDLGKDVDVVLMRQDPPFDLGYITATHLLERIQNETLVVNDPAAVRNAPEKVWVLDFARFMPPTMLTRSLGASRHFLAEHGDCVLKPLHGSAGKAVFKIGRDGANLAAGGTAEAAELTDTEREICEGLKPELKRRGLLFVGIDVIGGRWLTEINVTSPTGIVAVDKFNGTDTPGLIWQAIERKLKD